MRIAILLLSLNVLFSCKKDRDDIAPQSKPASHIHLENGFSKYSWSEKEACFFDLDSYKKFQLPGDLESRNNEHGTLIYHPYLVGLYDEIAERNETHPFIEEIVTKAGFPVWRYARIVEDTETQKSLIVVPLAFDAYPAVTSLITATKDETGFTINAITRQELLDTENGDPLRNVAYANALAGYDKILFGVEGEALEAYCDYVKILEENPPLGPNPALPPDEDCEWRFMEVCSDDVTQTTWFGGLSNMPPHLDHDGDGIINYDDQDWLQYNITQEQFEHYVELWWEGNYEQVYGSYHDFWNEDVWEDFVSTGGGQDFNDFWDDFSDIWQDFRDWITNDDYFGDDDIYYDPDPGDCYFGGPRQGGGVQVELRDVRCQWYYILYCGEEFNANNWWNVLTHVDCPECPNYQGNEDLYEARVKEYYDIYEQSFYPFTSFDDLVQTAQLIGCDAFSPYFEHCINEAYLVSVFGLGYTNIFTEEAINWLTVTPFYPQGPLHVGWIANYWRSEGYSEEARERIQTIINWVGSVNGLNINGNQLSWLLNHYDLTIKLIEGYTSEHFLDDDCLEIIEKMMHVHSQLEWGAFVPRAEYIDQIDAIRIYLGRRHTDYGETSQYLEAILPYLVDEETFTDEEVYAVYEISYNWYLECAYNTLSQTVRQVIKAIRPFIEMALIDGSFRIGLQLFSVSTNAARWLIASLPQSVKNASALVWNRISYSSQFRPNTNIPETFTLTAEGGREYYVQFSGTKHLAELVTKNEAATYAWFESQKGLRSQLVLDDFAKAVDEILSGNSPVIYENPYHAGKWEIIFGEPTTFSGGLPRIFHAVPVN